MGAAGSGWCVRQRSYIRLCGASWTWQVEKESSSGLDKGTLGVSPAGDES